MLSVIAYLSKLFQRSTLSNDDYATYKPPFANEPDDYRTLRAISEVKRQELLTSADRFQTIDKRQDRSDYPAKANWCISKGKYTTRYRGFDVCKCPQDFVIYHQLIDDLKPKTIIELGTLSGGWAVWMADTSKLLNIQCNIYSMDLDLSNLSDIVKEVKPDNVHFLQGDSFKIHETFHREFLSQLQHPWLIIEDAHANLPGVLRYFHQYCIEGDYIVVEDTNPEIAKEVGMGGVSDMKYTMMGRKQLNCLRNFLSEYQDYYAVDSFFNDMFGYNSSWHWHGFIRKMK